MTKKTFALFATLLVLWSAAQAQLTHTAQGTVDQQATSIIRKASAKMSGTVQFTVTVVGYDTQKKETFRQKAEVLYNAPRYRVKAGDIELYCDGESVWQLNKQAREVAVTAITQSEDDLTNPALLLANYSKNYRAKFIREEEDGTAVVDLQPKKSHSFHKVRLFIDKNGRLKKLEQHNYDSSRSDYIISNFKNTKAADGDFVYDFQSHPGTEVIDMR